MNLAYAHMVSRIATAREGLIDKRDKARIRVVINGEVTDGAIDLLVRPIVVAELDRQIADLDADLVALGVDLG